MATRKRTVKIIMCTDPMASMMHDYDQQKEYDAIERNMRETFPEFKMVFVRDIFPHQLANESFEIYLFDFGGMLPGCEDMVASQYRELARQVEDHPNALFLLYSSFSVRWYKELMEEDSGELKNQPNVVFYDYDEEWVMKVKEWLKM